MAAVDERVGEGIRTRPRAERPGRRGGRPRSVGVDELADRGRDRGARVTAGTPAPDIGGAEAQRFVASHRAWRLVVDEQFLTTMGIGLRSGRWMQPSDTDTTPVVAIVNEALAMLDRS